MWRVDWRSFIWLWLGLALSAPLDAHAAESLNLSPDPRILLPSLIVFSLLIYPVNKLLVSPLVRILQERDARISGAAERASELAEESAMERGRLDERLAQARAAAQARRGEILAEAKLEEQRLLDAARADAAGEIASMRDSVAGELQAAREALAGEARALAETVAARVLGRAL